VLHTKLSNGLTLTVIEDHSVPLVTLDMWVRVGSGDEIPGVEGISHFLEHMLFKGTPSLPVGQYDRNVEQVGGYLNAATSMDYTHYYVTIPSQHFDAILRDFSDVMMNSVIDPTELDSERQVVLEEIARKIDSPFGYLFDETIPAMFQSGPYRHPVIGSRESVSAITREQMLDHYHRFYTPENMFLSIVGDVDAAAVKARAEEAFASLDRPYKPWRTDTPEAVWKAPGDKLLPMDWNEAYFILAFPGPLAGTSREDMAMLEYAEGLLTGGRTARLTNALQEKRGIVSSIGCYFMSNRRAAPLLIYGTCEPAKLDEVRLAIIEEIGKLVKDGATSSEMRRVRRQSVNSNLYSLETNAGRASSVGYSLVMVGDTSLHDSYTDDLRKVKESDVIRFLKAYLVADRSSFFVTKRQEVKP
jgi:zinc protease